MNFYERAKASLGRRISARLHRNLVRLDLDQPLFSFSFDDFPKTALNTGGAILTHYGHRGTFYAAFGISGNSSPSGEIFSHDDITKLLRIGHELGCHTFHHVNAWSTKAVDFGASLAKNQEALLEFNRNLIFRTHSYPIATPHPANKHLASKRFICSRGGGATAQLWACRPKLLAVILP